MGLSVSVNNLRVVKESLIDENEKLHIENSVLKEQVLNKFMTFNDIPVYIWSKLKVGDKGYMMLRVNDYYYVGMMNPMGYKRTDYIGKYDYDIYGEKIASMFKIEDDKVAITGDTLTLMNRIDDTLRNIHKDLLITKWRRIEQNKDTFVLGQAVDITKLIEEIENNIKNNN